MYFEYLLKKHNQRLTDFNKRSFNHYSFLTQCEPEYNSNTGERVSKSYCYEGREIIRIKYVKIYDKVTLEGTELPNEFVGCKRIITYRHPDKSKEVTETFTYMFNLSAVKDENDNVISSTSPKKKRILDAEQYNLSVLQ